MRTAWHNLHTKKFSSNPNPCYKLFPSKYACGMYAMLLLVSVHLPYSLYLVNNNKFSQYIWRHNEDVLENIDPWEIFELVHSLNHLQLTTVQLNNVLWIDHGAHVGNIGANEYLKYAGNPIKLVKLLLMCCSKLEMVIIEEPPYLRDHPVRSELLQRLSKEFRSRAMASSAMASKNVEVCFA